MTASASTSRRRCRSLRCRRSPRSRCRFRSPSSPTARSGSRSWSAGPCVLALFSGMTGLATGLILLTVARSRVVPRQGGHRPDPQLADRRLLPDRVPLEGLQLPPGGQRRRCDSSDRSRRACSPTGSTGECRSSSSSSRPCIFALLALKSARAGPRPMGTPRDRSQPRRSSTPRRSRRRSRRVGAPCTRCSRCNASGGASRSSRPRSSGSSSLASLFYEQEFGLDERGRGVAAAIAEPFAIVGLVDRCTHRHATVRRQRQGSHPVRRARSPSVGGSGSSLLRAVAPNVCCRRRPQLRDLRPRLAIIGPGVLAALSLAIPPRARATGFSVGSLWAIPGLLVLPVIGWIADTWSIRVGMLVMIPVFVIGASSCAVGRPTSSTTTSRRSGSRPSPAPRCCTTAGRATPPCCWSAVSRPATASDRCCTNVDLELARGRDRRLARHERRRQVDAAQVDQRRRRGRPRRHRARRARHHARAAERDRRARHRADARRQGRVRLAHGRGEPRTGRMDEPARPGRRQGGDRRGTRDVPDPRRTTRLARGQPVRRPAADARAGDELHHASRRCC